jgi:hypothetical protein
MSGLGNNFNNGKGGNNGNNIGTLFTDENKSQMDNSILSTINNENMNTIKFNNIKNEMKKYCDSQFEIKQKLISYQSEINKMRETQSNKFKNLQKNIETNQNKYREISATIERIFNTNSAKKELSEFQKDYLTLMMKNSSYRIQILDNKYNNMLNNTDIDQKNDYILELENQIKLRDELINVNNIQTNNNIKTIETLRQQYTPRNPINLTGGFRRLLPPLSNQNKIINTNNNNDKINTSGMLFSNSSNQNPHINNMKNKFIKNNNKIGNNPYINSNNSNQKFKLINSNNIKPINLHINNNNLNTNNDFNSHRDKMNIKRDNSKKLFRYRGMSKENSHSFLLDNSNSNRNNSFLEKSPKVKRSDLKSAINDRNIRKQLSTNKIRFKGGEK